MTIEILLPVFGLVLCGFIAAKVRLISPGGVNGLMNFVQYFAVPALLFRIVVTNDVIAPDSLAILFTYFGGCLLVFTVAVLTGWLGFSLPMEHRGIFGMSSIFSNVVLLALPLSLTLFGEVGLVPILPIIAVHNLLLFPLVIIFVEIGRGRREATGNTFGTTIVSTIRNTVQNPIIVALILGFVWARVGWGMPATLDTFTGTLAKAVSPTALFALGASMAAYRFGGKLRESVTMVAFKLILHPAAVWMLGRYVFDLEPLHLSVVTLTAAMPIGATVFLLAHRYQVYLARATSALMISVLVSAASLPFLLMIFVQN